MPANRVLIVDDDPSVAELTARFVEGAGHEFIIANDAASAVSILSETHIDAFLLDVEMPGTGGIELCRLIRSLKEYEATPILFITGSNENLEKAFAAGCDDLIGKPLDPLVLQARLHGHLQRAKYALLLSNTRRMLNHYVSRRTREIAENAARTGVLPSPKRCDVVILFTDIRGFTAMSEDIHPDELFSLVSGQLAKQVHLIYGRGGYVDKFGGDGLMAIFDGEDMAEQSCLCALDIVRAALESSGGDERIQQLGIGIHMGPVVVGNIGSSEHFDYSVIGNAVNLAARLCGHASPMSIVVSKTVRDAAATTPG